MLVLVSVLFGQIAALTPAAAAFEDVELDHASGFVYVGALNNAFIHEPAAPAIVDSSVGSLTRIGDSEMRPSPGSVAPGSTVSGTARARQLGVEGEVLAGIDPNVVKTRIPSLTGSANYRVPDALTDSVLTGVKNVQRLGYTSQIQDFSYYATQTGRQFDLVVRENTVLTRELQDIVNMTGSPINVIRGLPAG
ncbi:MAG: hypothetical protein GY701_23620 [Sulfitobacter sp.]|nr:hypothetical protein [Sulfitobacter sp.]